MKSRQATMICFLAIVGCTHSDASKAVVPITPPQEAPKPIATTPPHQPIVEVTRTPAVPAGLQLAPATYESTDVRYQFEAGTFSVWRKAPRRIIEVDGKARAMNEPIVLSQKGAEEFAAYYNDDRWLANVGKHYWATSWSAAEAVAGLQGTTLPYGKGNDEGAFFVDMDWFEQVTNYHAGDWVPEITKAKYTMAGTTSLSLDWSSCTPGSLCAAMGANTDSDVANLESNGLELVIGDKRLKASLNH